MSGFADDPPRPPRAVRQVAPGRPVPRHGPRHLADTPSDVAADRTAMQDGGDLRARRRQLAPWAARRPGPGTDRRRDTGTDRRRDTGGPARPPVFVDDSGRRRRRGRLVAAVVAVAVLGYLVIIALNLAGVPFVGRLAPPGVDRLARPSGDGAVMAEAGAALAAVDAAPSGGPPSDQSDADRPDSAAPAPVPTSTVSTTVAPAPAPTTTSTTVAGRGATTSVPAPSSTVPTTHPTGGGRPDDPPGKG